MSSRTDSAWNDCRLQLEEIRASIIASSSGDDASGSDDDGILKALQKQTNRAQQFTDKTSQHASKADTILQQLEVQIASATETSQKESAALAQLQADVVQLKSLQHQLQQALQDADDQQHELLLQIAAQQQAATTAQHDLTRTQQDSQTLVPQLQYQLSLYAACTGVKWNFDQTPAVLAGEMGIPSTQEIRRFSVDPDGLSRFEIANQLWALMDGTTV